MLYEFFSDYVMALVPVMLRMQLRGIDIDLAERARLRDIKVAERQAAADRLRALFPNRKLMGPKTVSSKELIKLLYDDMGLPKQINPKTKRPTANAEALERLEKYIGDDLRPAFKDILDVRDLGVLISTFLDCPLDSDNRMRWSTNLGGTSVGRISTGASPWWTGGNVQNVPDEVRTTFIADPGCGFAYLDGEQAEGRVVAKLSKDPALIAIYESGRNSHFMVAHQVFGAKLPVGEAEETAFKETQIYKDSKRTAYACSYGMGKRKAAMLFGCTEREAEEKMRRFHNTFPCVRSMFQADAESLVRRSRMLRSPFGRQRTFYGRMDDDLLRKAYGYVPEATVADWLDIGLLRVVRFTKGLWEVPKGHILERYLTLDPEKLRFVKRREDMLVDIEPCINVHDGLLAQFKLADTLRAVAALKECLTYEIPFEAGPLIIPVDCKIGFNWGKVKKATPERMEYLMKEAA